MTNEIDTYWQEDIKLFNGIFNYYRGNPQPVRAKIHTNQERYHQGETEIIPIKPSKGERTYIMIHPYTQEPNIILTIGIPPGGYADTPAIGKVQSSRVKGFRDIQAGSIQAWYYHDAKILVLWECFFNSIFRNSTPLTEDKNMLQLWQTIEKHLHTTFPQAEQINTPFSDPLFPIEEYQTFLRLLDYEPVAQAVYGKLL